MSRRFLLLVLLAGALAGYEVHQSGPEAFGGGLAFLFPEPPAARRADGGRVVESTDGYRDARGRLERRWLPD